MIFENFERFPLYGKRFYFKVLINQCKNIFCKIITRIFSISSLLHTSMNYVKNFHAILSFNLNKLLLITQVSTVLITYKLIVKPI